MRVLIIDDDAALTALLAQHLGSRNYVVDSVADGETGWAYASTFEYDLIILDWLLPQLDGIHLCQRLRQQHYEVPILLLTAKDKQTDKITGLEAGADDYVVKPFDMQELLVRVQVLLRRAIAGVEPLLVWGHLCLDQVSCQVSYQGQPVSVTAKEYTLLELFLRHSNQVFSATALLGRVWSSEEFPSEATVRSHIRGLRQKLKRAGATADLIETVHGLGYRLKAANSNAVNLDAACREDTREARYLAGLHQAWSAHKGESIERWNTLVQIADSLSGNRSSNRDGNWDGNQSGNRAGKEDGKDKNLANYHASMPALSEQQQHQAQQMAHSLAGTLGTFGLMEGYRLALQIEQILLQSGPQITRSQIAQLQTFVTALGHALDEDPKLVCPVEDAPPAPEILILDVNDMPYVQQLMALSVAQGLGTTVVASIEAASQALSLDTQMQDISDLLLDLPDLVMVNFVASKTHCVLDESILQRLLKFITRLAERWPQLPVVVVTPQADFGNRLDFIRRGGAIILEYPVVPAEVLSTICQMTHLGYRLSKIMIVDDDAHYLKQVIQLLHPWDFQITPLTNPQRFWTLFNQISPDLVILDIEMPHINGFELCQVIRSHVQWQHLPIVFMSVHGGHTQREQAFALGADDYITKPVQGKPLAARLLNRLKRSSTRLNASSVTGLG